VTHPSAIQRAPATRARHKQAEPKDPETYAELMQGINHLAVAASKANASGVGGVAFGDHLARQHRDLLINLRSALVMAYTPAPGQHRAALGLWNTIQPDLTAAVRRAPEFVDGDVSAIRQDLTWMSEQVIRPAAYQEARAEARANSGLKAPDLAFQKQRLEQAEEELEQAKAMAEEAGKLTSAGVAAIVLHDADMGKEIFELVTLKGTIEEKLAHAKELGIVGRTATAVELVSKVAGLTNTITKTTIEFLKTRAEHLAEEALEKGLQQLGKHWTELAEGYEKKIQSLKTFGKVLGMIGVFADALRAFKAAWNGDWEEALKNAANAGMGVLGALGAEGSAPLLGAITITVKAELEAIHLAAEFIRWCKDETVREAAEKFIDACSVVAKNVAFDFVADVELMLSADSADIRDMAAKQLTGHAARMKQSLEYLGAQMALSEKKWPGLVPSLGAAAAHALSNPIDAPNEPLTMAEQIRDVFAGANAMAEYVKKNYPTDTEKKVREQKEKKKTGADGED
jgi:hypothetical protein